MDFYHETGKMALGSRLRHLSERFMEDAAKIYALYDVPLDPKWFPVFYVLSHQTESSITEIAQTISHSHPSVSQIVKEMKKSGFVVTAKSTQDGRVNMVKLSEIGQQLLPKIEQQYLDVTQAAEDLLASAQHNLWKAIEEVEYLLSEKTFFERVQSVRKSRERQQIEIIDYAPMFLDDFKRLNYAWIEHYFEVEDTDCQYLDYPEANIIQPGGHILMVRYQDTIVGTCALVKQDKSTYELAKMGVDEKVRGRGIGFVLGQAAIAKARSLGAKTIFLESNTILEPAINLYHKLGFRKVFRQPSPYERCDIQMELNVHS